MWREPRTLRIGVDVGGTHTDAVVLGPDDSVLAKTKVTTSHDTVTGIATALALVAAEVSDPGAVGAVMVGTTHATNAVIGRTGLAKVAAIRVGSPWSDAVPPLSGWPADLIAAVDAAHVCVAGGSHVDGRALDDLDEDAVRRFLQELPADCTQVAATSIFSSVDHRHELRVQELAHEVLGPDTGVSLSHEIGGLGLLARENATILNAALNPVMSGFISCLVAALRESTLSDAALYLSQNDGTLMSVADATLLPVLTIGSGPANSVRGAAVLSGVQTGLVVDVGGTSTDIGALRAGFPRESSVGAVVGGVATNFRMPDLVSVAVGGGSVVDDRGRIGPHSVGPALAREALAFGGSTATLTDAAVLVGRTAVGSHRVPDRPELRDALSAADRLVQESIELMRTTSAAVPVVLVGGGSIVLPDHIEGASSVLRPEHHEVANAVGAAIADVGGTADRVFPLAQCRREEAVDQAIVAATAEAGRAGADLSRAEVIDVAAVELTYLDQPAVRVVARVAGPLLCLG